MSLFSKQIDKRIAAYQRELIETHYREVENMYRQIRGWRHDYRNHIQTMKVLAANGDMDAIKAYLDELTPTSILWIPLSRPAMPWQMRSSTVRYPWPSPNVSQSSVMHISR